MSRTYVHVDLGGGVGTIALGLRPEQRNALSRGLLRELASVLEDLRGHIEVRAIVLQSSAGDFCGGMDLTEMRNTLEGPRAEDQWPRDAELFRELLDAMLRFPKPIVCGIEGACLGGGVALACASDLVVSHASARFAVPAPRRGIVAGLVAPVLAFRTSIGVATRLLLSSEEINGAEAHRLGIVHHLAGTDQVPERTRAVALDFALSAPQSLNLTKRLIYECLGEQLSAQLATGAAMTAASQTTAAAEEGIRAFAEKRMPRWE